MPLKTGCTPKEGRFYVEKDEKELRNCSAEFGVWGYA